jgi:hypothetical protein
MIKKFENYIQDDLNKLAIDSVSVIESTTPDGDVYKHTLEFVLPYHENELIDMFIESTEIISQIFMVNALTKVA